MNGFSSEPELVLIHLLLHFSVTHFFIHHHHHHLTMASFPLPLRLHPPLPPFSGFQNSSKLCLIPFQVRETKKKKIHILSCSNLQNSSSSSSSSSSSWEEREEKRWEREEQRWLREEQRWVREESRWNSEKESLHQEIADLKFKIQTLLKRRNSISEGSSSSTSDGVSNMATIFPIEMNRISESSGSGGVPLLLNSESEEVEEVKEVIEIEKEVRVSERSREEVEESQRKIVKKKKKPLKMGAEGEEVRLLQEALQKLGFYSGEEDMEYSSFSSGTESAVKTWQASIDVTEDGIVTEELLERLLVEEEEEEDGTIGLKKINEDHKGGDFVKMVGDNGASAAIHNNSSPVYTERPRDRVFLLGENRWEDPSRLTNGRNKQGVMVTPTTGGTKCITCRGEGRLLCLECDGTGEPNIEEQFMDWVDEAAAKCPYCEGLGYIICDVCEGNPLPL